MSGGGSRRGWRRIIGRAARLQRARPGIDGRGRVPPVAAGRPATPSAIQLGPPRIAATLTRLFLALAIGYGALAGGLGFWQVVEATRLTSDPLNPLVLLAARQAPRGAIYDNDGNVLARNRGGNDGTPQRDYPYPVAAPVVGYRSTIFGATGLERTYDAQLTGLLSLRPADELLRKFRSQPYNPSDVYTSINIALQQTAARELGNRRGAVVAMEPTTGRVLALVSNPTFDPNRVVGPGARRYVSELQQQTDSPLLNRATQGLYVPGSVIKIVTAMGALGSGSISPQTTYPEDPDEFETGFLVEGFRIRESPRRVQRDHPLDFYEATEVSSNIWYAHAGLDTGAENLLAWAARLGFGERIPFELATSPSQLNGGDGTLAGFRDRVELANAAYGQGEALVTPLQMALVASAVANDGLLMRPKLTDHLQAADGSVTRLDPQAWGQVVDFGTAQAVGDAMQLAVEGPFGREFAGAAKVPGVPTAGKSGTAQLGGDAAPHSWFIGYAPADAPRIAIAVIVEGGGAGAQVAVPMAGRLMGDYLDIE